MLIINIIVFFNILVIASLLLLRKNNPLPNIVLALIFITLGLNFINNINILTGNIYQMPWVYFFVQGTACFFALYVIGMYNWLSMKNYLSELGYWSLLDLLF